MGDQFTTDKPDEHLREDERGRGARAGHGGAASRPHHQPSDLRFAIHAPPPAPPQISGRTPENLERGARRAARLLVASEIAMAVILSIFMLATAKARHREENGDG